MINEKQEIKSVLLKKCSYEKNTNTNDPNAKNKSHIKRNSATIKLISKENLDAFETNKPYNSLVRGCKQILLETKFNDKK